MCTSLFSYFHCESVFYILTSSSHANLSPLLWVFAMCLTPVLPAYRAELHYASVTCFKTEIQKQIVTWLLQDGSLIAKLYRCSALFLLYRNTIRMQPVSVKMSRVLCCKETCQRRAAVRLAQVDCNLLPICLRVITSRVGPPVTSDLKWWTSWSLQLLAISQQKQNKSLGNQTFFLVPVILYYSEPLSAGYHQLVELVIYILKEYLLHRL